MLKNGMFTNKLSVPIADLDPDSINGSRCPEIADYRLGRSRSKHNRGHSGVTGSRNRSPDQVAIAAYLRCSDHEPIGTPLAAVVGPLSGSGLRLSVPGAGRSENWDSRQLPGWRRSPRAGPTGWP